MGGLDFGKTCKASLEDVLLRAAHAGCIAPRQVIIPIQMQESMNDVKGEFLVCVVAVLSGISGSGLGACDDFAMLERNDVCGPGNIHETPVHIGNDPVGNDGDFHLLDGLQGKASIRRIFPADLQGDRGQFPQPR